MANTCAMTKNHYVMKVRSGTNKAPIVTAEHVMMQVLAPRPPYQKTPDMPPMSSSDNITWSSAPQTRASNAARSYPILGVEELRCTWFGPVNGETRFPRQILVVHVVETAVGQLGFASGSEGHHKRHHPTLLNTTLLPSLSTNFWTPGTSVVYDYPDGFNSSLAGSSV